MAWRFSIWIQTVVVFCILVKGIHGLDTLYSFSEPIAQLTTTNFSSTISGQNHAWIVEYYASWCGHCQRLAPTWRNFARDIQGWHKVVKVGSMACSDIQNAPTCRSQNVHGYPLIKFYPPNFGRTVRSYQYQGAKAERQLREATIDYVQRVQQITFPWPKLTASRTISDISTSGTSDTMFYFVIVEDRRVANSGYVAREVILDLSDRYPQIVVGRMGRSDAERLGVRNFPSLHRIMPDGSLVILPSTADRRGWRDAIRAYSQSQGRPDLPRQPQATQAPVMATTQEVEVSTRITLSDGLHMQDLESSLFNMFWNEIPAQGRIEGETLVALKNHINVLAKYHPGKEYIRRFLNRTNGWLQSLNTPISGEQWVYRINESKSDDTFIPNRILWTGCRGSEERYRGYPCSVWMTFHAMTVNALAIEENNPNFDPKEVLRAMEGYMRHFFGCRECAGNFQTMANTMGREVTSRKDGVLWLWHAHNRANKRLHGDASEDPVHSKIQFPAYQSCISCRYSTARTGFFDDQTTWVEDGVLRYLQRFYSKDSIIDDVAPSEYGAPVSQRGPPRGRIPDRRPNREPDRTQTRDQREPDRSTNRGQGRTQSRDQRISDTQGRREPGRSQIHGPQLPSRVTDRVPVRVLSRDPRLPRIPPVTTTVGYEQVQTTPPSSGGLRYRQHIYRINVRNQTSYSNQTIAGCVPVVRRWSQCSQSCGPGYSVRLTNQNSECRLRHEVRVCTIRPCETTFVTSVRLPNGQVECGATYRSSRSSPLHFGTCRTRDSMQWQFCGQCTGQCCYPAQSQTRDVEVICSGNQQGRVKLQWIDFCQCAAECPRD